MNPHEEERPAWLESQTPEAIRRQKIKWIISPVIMIILAACAAYWLR
tara:strand:+ start:5271 stop:5411 length:141 start_codon:yes stop_codon:yes gene_type:complete